MDISVADFHRNAHMPLHTSRAENRAEGFSYASMVTNHLADVFRMNSQFGNSQRLSLDRANLHFFGMVHESLWRSPPAAPSWPISACASVSSSVLATRRGSRKADKLARSGHSLLVSTQKLDRPAAMSLWVRWSNTTYSPGDSVVSSLMRMLADAKSLTGSNLRKLPAGSFFRISNGECMDASCFAWCCKAN